MTALPWAGLLVTACLALAMWLELILLPGLLLLALALCGPARPHSPQRLLFTASFLTCLAEAAVWFIAVGYGSGIMYTRDDLVAFCLLCVEAGLAGYLSLASKWRLLPLLLALAGAWLWARWVPHQG